ncbi:MAG TPA: PAS domain-containing protein [Candidatus Saccharimonadia bacterium]|nr:PAS domain-containing protein [Candidatus Saccharimonadia bacterium]
MSQVRIPPGAPGNNRIKEIDPSVLAHGQQLAASDPAGIVAIYSTTNETCMYASPSHKSLLGYTPEEMIGKKWTEVVAPEDHAHANLAGSDAFLNGKSIEFGIRAVTRNGQRVPLRGTARVLGNPSTGAGYLLFHASAV